MAGAQPDLPARTRISFTLGVSLLDEIDAAADEAGLKRPEWIEAELRDAIRRRRRKARRADRTGADDE